MPTPRFAVASRGIEAVPSRIQKDDRLRTLSDLRPQLNRLVRMPAKRYTHRRSFPADGTDARTVEALVHCLCAEQRARTTLGKRNVEASSRPPITTVTSSVSARGRGAKERIPW